MEKKELGARIHDEGVGVGEILRLGGVTGNRWRGAGLGGGMVVGDGNEGGRLLGRNIIG